MQKAIERILPDTSTITDIEVSMRYLEKIKTTRQQRSVCNHQQIGKEATSGHHNQRLEK